MSSENRPEFKFSVKTNLSLNPSLPVQRFGPISTIVLILFPLTAIKKKKIIECLTLRVTVRVKKNSNNMGGVQ